MTLESDLRVPRGLNPNTLRGHPYLAYIREQGVPAGANTIPGQAATACRQCASAPANHADLIQATLFADMLRAEHAELGAVVRSHPPDDRSSAEQLLQLQARMKEVRRLIEALEKRFGHLMTNRTSRPPTTLDRDDLRR